MPSTLFISLTDCSSPNPELWLRRRLLLGAGPTHGAAEQARRVLVAWKAATQVRLLDTALLQLANKTAHSATCVPQVLPRDSSRSLSERILKAANSEWSRWGELMT